MKTLSSPLYSLHSQAKLLQLLKQSRHPYPVFTKLLPDNALQPACIFLSHCFKAFLVSISNILRLNIIFSQENHQPFLLCSLSSLINALFLIREKALHSSLFNLKMFILFNFLHSHTYTHIPIF